MNNISEEMYFASIKADKMMTSKYGDAWFIKTIIDEEETIEIKPEYVKEYDDLYNKFLNI